jgi:AraC-like DNA-binding protein/quercetin dioxygenase-like cupin family protein
MSERQTKRLAAHTTRLRKQAANPPDRAFVSTQYTVQFRHAARLKWKIEPQPNYSILVLLHGDAIAQVSSQEVRLASGDALLCDPGTEARAIGRDVNYLTFTVSPAFVFDFAARTRMSLSGTVVAFREPFVRGDPKMLRIVSDIATELTANQAGREVLIAALMDQLAVHLLRDHSNIRRSNELELSRVGLVDRRIRRAVELMQANLDRELPLKEIASAAYLSSFHFARLFKKVTGTSPHAYLGTLRIERARAMLADTDLSISEIGTRVGYSSSSHFTKAFRDATGLAPRAFRSAIITRR